MPGKSISKRTRTNGNAAENRDIDDPRIEDFDAE